MKNILLVDDSALMRRVLCDIINGDERFHVQDRAVNGLEALDLLCRKTYAADEWPGVIKGTAKAKDFGESSDGEHGYQGRCKDNVGCLGIRRS